MTTIDTVLHFLARHARLVLAAGVFIGLAAPPFAAFIRPLLEVSVFILLTAAFARLDWQAVAVYVRRPAILALVVPWLLFGTAALTALVIWLLPLPAPIKVALVLTASAPPIVSSIPFAYMLRLDPALAAVALFGTTMLVPFTAPLMASLLIDGGMAFDLSRFMIRLVILAFGAAGAAALIRRRYRPGQNAEADQRLDGVTVIVLLIFAIAIMDGVTAVLFERPGYVVLCAVVAFAANLSLQLAAGMVFHRLGTDRALTIGMISGNRNMAMMMAALPASADFDLVLFFAVGQLPIYMLPALMTPVYGAIKARTSRP